MHELIELECKHLMAPCFMSNGKFFMFLLVNNIYKSRYVSMLRLKAVLTAGQGLTAQFIACQRSIWGDRTHPDYAIICSNISFSTSSCHSSVLKMTCQQLQNRAISIGLTVFHFVNLMHTHHDHTHSQTENDTNLVFQGHHEADITMESAWIGHTNSSILLHPAQIV